MLESQRRLIDGLARLQRTVLRQAEQPQFQERIREEDLPIIRTDRNISRDVTYDTRRTDKP